MKRKFDYNKEILINWEISHNKFICGYDMEQCKCGIKRIEEVRKGTQNKVFLGKKELKKDEFDFEEIFKFDELLKYYNYEVIDHFILFKILKLKSIGIFENIDFLIRCMKNTYDNRTILYYERKISFLYKTDSYEYKIEPYYVYYCMKNKIDRKIMRVLKKIGFTGKFKKIHCYGK